MKTRGKIIRESLSTNVFTTARLRLADFLKEKRTSPLAAEGVLVGRAMELYQESLRQNPALKPRSRGYRDICLRKIRTTWTGIELLPIGALTEAACRSWAAELRTSVAPQYFNR